jgi:hypothetical protein
VIAAINMNPANYKTKRKGQPKRNKAKSRSESRTLANAKVAASYTTPKLREIYATKKEWATKVIPKPKEQVAT